MNTIKTTETRTVVRHPEHLSISSYSISAFDSYSKEDREVVDIVGDGDQIINAFIDWVAGRHREAQNLAVPTVAEQATQDLARLAGAMGLEYPAKTTEA
jgi:hypothetical protein